MASASRALDARARRMRPPAAAGFRPSSPSATAGRDDDDDLFAKVEYAKRTLHEQQAHLEVARKAGNRALVFGSCASVAFLLLAIGWWVAHLRETRLPAYCDDVWQEVPLASDEGNLLHVKRTLRPLVSVVIPYFNAEAYLAETVKSLEWQTFQDFEVVVVDDASHSVDARRTLEGLLMRRPGFASNATDEASDDRRSLSFPVRFVCHKRNRGLSAARNSGAVASRGQLLAFLDPDDILEPTALEKLVLLAAHLRSFPGASPQYRNVFVYAGTQYFGDRDDISMIDYSKRHLLADNFLPSFALISRESFLQTGGNCEGVVSFEAYDFWLRLAGRNLGGKLLREPLFGYRVHPRARSNLVRRHLTEQEWHEELRANNPIAYSDALGSLHLATWPECHARSLAPDTSVPAASDRWRGWLQGRQTTRSSGRGSRASAIDGMASVIGLMRQRHDVNRILSILYLMPWMVVNGADLYDYYVLQTLRDTGQFRITVVIEQPVPWPHPWKNLFDAVADEIFYLPTLSNATAGRQSVLDYLMLSREAAIVVNRNTDAGYQAFARWAEPADPTSRAAVGGQHELRLVDILHLSEYDDDAGPTSAATTAATPAGASVMAAAAAAAAWEVRSLPLHNRIHRRFLASEHLHTVMHRRWHVDPEDTRFLVLPPPVDPAQFTEPLASATKDPGAPPTVVFLGRLDDQKDPLLWLATACLVLRDVPNAEFRMFGEGPLQSSLEHALWLADQQEDGHARPASPTAHARRASRAQTAADGATDRRGGGPSHRLPAYVVQTVVDSGCNVAAISLEGAVPHDQTADRLSEASVLLLSSTFEGTPVVILEAMCLGVPVVAPAIGGITSMLANSAGVAVKTQGQTKLQVAESLARHVVQVLRAGPPAASARLRQHHDCMATYGLDRFQATVQYEFQALAASVDTHKRQRELQAGRAGYWQQLLSGSPLQ